MDNALMQMCSRNGYCKKAPIFTNSTAAIESILEIDILPRERVTEINLSVKELKRPSEINKIPVTMWPVVNEMADYMARKLRQSAKRLFINYNFVLLN